MRVLDEKIKINKYFEDICLIPHGSYHEEKISKYLEDFAIEHNLEYVRDKYNNVVIYKEAYKGYEDSEPVMLQGHMDMVCEKEEDSNINFETDSLELLIEDGYVTASKTTLGADDGYGVAYMLGILDDKSIKAPRLVCVFTVQEEVGLFGAKDIDPKLLTASRMIGLDSDWDGVTCVSSSGGREVNIYRTLTKEDNNSKTYSISITGLLGGHSGDKINVERGNANRLVVRTIKELLDNDIDLNLISFNGGTKDNAITTSSIITFSSNSNKEDIQVIINKMIDGFNEEFELSDPNIQVVFKKIDQSLYHYSKNDTKDIISLLFLAPNGLLNRSMAIKDLPTVSLNLGIVETKEDKLRVVYSIRSPMESKKEELTNILLTLCKTFNCAGESVNDYPGWNYDPDSNLRKLLKDEYHQYFSRELKEEATHGGLETGIFKGYNDKLDIVTFGPECLDIHTPQERMNIKSFNDNYKFLVKFLSKL
ncbi:MAG: beta-Ala-His dipeptidase [Thomasclavelia sp.]|nr:beta-Ala-His dipeptidase [Thomasclavelia sp.]